MFHRPQGTVVSISLSIHPYSLTDDMATFELMTNLATDGFKTFLYPPRSRQLEERKRSSETACSSFDRPSNSFPTPLGEEEARVRKKS